MAGTKTPTGVASKNRSSKQKQNTGSGDSRKNERGAQGPKDNMDSKDSGSKSEAEAGSNGDNTPSIKGKRESEGPSKRVRSAQNNSIKGKAGNVSSSPSVLDQVTNDQYSLINGDCIEVVKGIPSESIHFSIHSPPFAALYTYSATERDLGNCKNDAEFFEHYKFLIPELFRITKPGRMCAVHCQCLPSMKERHGVIGLRDFRGEVIRNFVAAGWIFHTEVCIWKNPVVEMQRTKSIGLLWKQLKKDSCMSRVGLPDYLVVMRKPGDNQERVAHTEQEFPVSEWQQIASPVWLKVDYTKTLQSMREEKDEKHICPIALNIVENAIRLWTNRGDFVFTPFLGIGSEIYQAIKMGRRGIGVELKPAYFVQACKNVKKAMSEVEQGKLFKN